MRYLRTVAGGLRPVCTVSAACLLLVSAAWISSPRRPAYGSVTPNNTVCTPTKGESCADCSVEGTVYGCQDPIPAGWTAGTCATSPTSNCQYYNPSGSHKWNCGIVYNRTTDQVYNACPSYILCQ